MKSHPIKVPITKTWNAVQRHNVYSCPDTVDYDFVIGAESLLLESKRLNVSVLRWVDCSIATTGGEHIRKIPKGLQSRFFAYRKEVIGVPHMLSGDKHRFYFLLPTWLQAMGELVTLDNEAALSIWRERHKYFKWPKRSLLLQRGWTRHHDGSRSDCYSYDSELKTRLTAKRLEPDGRNNGPAILAFLMAEGTRPRCNGGGWPIHHVYDGSAEHPVSRKKILHSVQNGDFFTQSAGLVAAHPVAHCIAHQSPLLGWLLRWEAYKRFTFDPDRVFDTAVP
ncbi:MAG TPA: hypothetical protein VK530_00710 [Candidatus Acidoferrum sp.]|nr:hypothetical protein [Candidatus Acidoferrum sp.]